MAVKSKAGFRFTIRKKLLLVSLALLSIPYVGYEYVREMERYLQQSLVQNLSDVAHTLAGVLRDRDELFPANDEVMQNGHAPLFMHTLTHPVQVDGYADDWQSYLDWAELYQQPQGPAFKLILGAYKQELYVLLKVQDQKVIYEQAGAPFAHAADRIQLVMTNKYGQLQRYQIGTSAPGKLSPYKVQRDWMGEQFTQTVTNISGEWQQSSEGYILELRIPRYLLGDRLGFVVENVDTANAQESIKLGTAGLDTLRKPGYLLQSSTAISRMISGMGEDAGRRIWVLGQQGHVVASYGNLVKPSGADSTNFIYALILPSASEHFVDDLAGASRLRGEEVRSALQGEPASRWRSSPDGRAVIVSAATPIKDAQGIIGAVVVEETTNAIQTIQQQAMATLFNKTIVIFLLVTLLLLVFATRLSIRLRGLSHQAETAIDRHGKVVTTEVSSPSSDEIGDMSRRFSAMLERLKHYNDYLESLASKLSHELRTPMAVVRSSLENMESPEKHAASETETAQEQQVYLQRAREGMDRLATLVTRLSESARIEQALQSAELEQIDLTKLLASCIEGYRSIYPGAQFKALLSSDNCRVQGCPDLLVQMLDKLISNAVDFSSKNQPIEIHLTRHKHTLHLIVLNYGPCLPEEMTGELFNSMVSVRDGTKQGEPHLGLGLYIVRKIAEFHQGDVIARNLEQGDGVAFVVRLPVG